MWPEVLMVMLLVVELCFCVSMEVSGLGEVVSCPGCVCPCVCGNDANAQRRVVLFCSVELVASLLKHCLVP